MKSIWVGSTIKPATGQRMEVKNKKINSDWAVEVFDKKFGGFIESFNVVASAQSRREKLVSFALIWVNWKSSKHCTIRPSLTNRWTLPLIDSIKHHQLEYANRSVSEANQPHWRSASRQKKIILLRSVGVALADMCANKHFHRKKNTFCWKHKLRIVKSLFDVNLLKITTTTKHCESLHIPPPLSVITISSAGRSMALEEESIIQWFVIPLTCKEWKFRESPFPLRMISIIQFNLLSFRFFRYLDAETSWGEFYVNSSLLACFEL